MNGWMISWLYEWMTRWLDESKSGTKTFSPTDLFFPEDQNAENTCQTFISPGVDMLIKFHDMLKAIVGFNLRLSGGKLRMFSFCCDYLGFKISAEGIKMQPKYLSTITKYKIPKNKRVANSQKCLRVSGKHNDMKEVGVDNKYTWVLFEKNLKSLWSIL